MGDIIDTRVIVHEVPHKRQTKVYDCWYACIQMLLRWRVHTKNLKPIGDAVAEHRNRAFLGRRLAQNTAHGRQILRDNGLVEVGSKIKSNEIGSVLHVLMEHGPFIVGGAFARFAGRDYGHDVVICGVNLDTDMIYVDDPGWGEGKSWKPLTFLNKAWRVGNLPLLKSHTAIAFPATRE